ncbi:hypothetical protein H9X57_01585 [Flavobacterium piscinae]|uniref:Uncharacterized protein n=1 Tax=Flavobacterium piscinae TaxID=2506424 RepID=A0A4Q1KNB3_9FLAO|nr:hypothetical protein [Flavobacterium piscinae]MBC8882566.1 hypothetical protein [Flavobacterium piscinae]RXR31252.1 hypothetical protein EQG68_10215 [Flavobacterium piscinae]
MRKTLIIITMSLSYVLIFCSEKKTESKKEIIKIETPEYVKMNKNSKLTDSLLNVAISKGDEKVYNTVAGNFILDANYEGLLYYSLMMANKYNSPEAHYHIFLILSNPNNGQPFEQLDDKTKNLALYHLVKSDELGYESAKYSIKEVFGNDEVNQKSDFYLKKYNN